MSTTCALQPRSPSPTQLRPAARRSAKGPRRASESRRSQARPAPPPRRPPFRPGQRGARACRPPWPQGSPSRGRPRRAAPAPGRRPAACGRGAAGSHARPFAPPRRRRHGSASARRPHTTWLQSRDRGAGRGEAGFGLRTAGRRSSTRRRRGLFPWRAASHSPPQGTGPTRLATRTTSRCAERPGGKSHRPALRCSPPGPASTESSHATTRARWRATPRQSWEARRWSCHRRT
mmetsp:Transcript_12184/g.40115  ORF Transcript_12184/g.40115 Transcript_12184/m.40115 type:complete len:233 (+) Transcript_12184:90-788(+)